MSGTIVFYISGHGLGHASRTIEFINALLARRPELRIVVRTTAPNLLFDLTLRRSAGLKPGPSRVGEGPGAGCSCRLAATDSRHWITTH